MNFLALTIDSAWLALTCVGVVFAILVVLVVILQVFTLVAKKTATKAFANASDEDKAAVAMALYLYEEEKKNLESRVLTITHTSQTWTSQLNPRL